ncbi:MAG: hypothetical protein HYX94_02390 [Chloroflexi bacterium]|nr:hypothetical protein [Chloroflexota bacterium]
MKRPISIAEFISVIRRLPPDEPHPDPRVWYKTQKEHWLGWLEDYDGPGAYGRVPNKNRDAKFAFNHVVCPEMLLWLIEAAGTNRELVDAARRASESGPTMMQKSGLIRKLVPWTEVVAAIWGADNHKRKQLAR